MTGIEDAAKATGNSTTTDEDSSKQNGSKYSSFLRLSSSSSTKSEGSSPKKIARSKSLTEENKERVMVRGSQSEVWDKETREKRIKTKQKKKSGVLIKPTISPEDEALFQSRSRRRKKLHDNGVKFGFVQIREHAITIGDNPGGYKGPPLSIEWKAQNEVKMPLDEYEENRPFRRSGAQMNIPFRVRERMLLDAGFSRGEIREALRDVNVSRRKRRRTIEVMNLSSVHEFTERFFRGSLNFTLRRGSKKKERAYLKKAWDVHRQMEDMDLEDGKPLDGEDEDDKEFTSCDLGDATLQEFQI